MLSWNLKLKTINFIAERPSCCHLIMSIWSVCSPEVTIIQLSCHCCNCWDRGDMEMARISAEPPHCTTPELPLVYNDMLFPPNNAFFETMRWNTFSSSLVLILIIFCTLIVIVNVVWKLLDSSHRCLKNITWLVVFIRIADFKRSMIWIFFLQNPKLWPRKGSLKFVLWLWFMMIYEYLCGQVDTWIQGYCPPGCLKCSSVDLSPDILQCNIWNNDIVLTWSSTHCPSS